MGTNGFNTEQEDDLSLENRPVIFTTDEEGNNHQFQMVDMIEVESQTYALLLYLGQGDEEQSLVEEIGEDTEMVVMKIVQEGDDQVFEMLEDDEEYERVLAYLETLEDDEEEGEHEPHEHGPGCNH